MSLGGWRQAAIGISDRHSRGDTAQIEHPCSENDISVSPGMRDIHHWYGTDTHDTRCQSRPYLPTAPQCYRRPTPQ